MNEKDFNQLVDFLRDESVPACPGNFEQNVLRRIRSGSTVEATVADWFANWLHKPVFVGAAIAIVVLSSFATASLLSLSHSPADPVAALGFDVFSESILLPTDH